MAYRIKLFNQMSITVQIEEHLSKPTQFGKPSKLIGVGHSCVKPPPLKSVPRSILGTVWNVQPLPMLLDALLVLVAHLMWHQPLVQLFIRFLISKIQDIIS